MPASSVDKKKKNDDTAEHRMTALYLLAQGKMPSWRQTQRKDNSQSGNRKESSSALEKPKPFLSRRVLLYLWILNIAFKVLLFPSYKSTDFFVHRHWKALTYRPNQLSILQWYSDDEIFPSSKTEMESSQKQNKRSQTSNSVQTVHTLDYPPGFAWMEYFMANLVPPFWFSSQRDNCFDLIDDVVAYRSMSNLCVAYMRTTVLIFADTIYWFGAYVVASSVVSRNNAAIAFLVLIFHPALLWLDHVHFQYNGTMLGLLLISLGCLLHANVAATANRWKDHYFYWIATMTFVFLLTMKHLYLTNSLWFVVYLFRRYCCSTVPQATSTQQDSAFNRTQIVWSRVLILFALTMISIVIPFLPFFVELYYNDTDPSTTFSLRLLAWFHQLGRRLFPFGRGLVHSYWAGNVWALYVAFYKVLTRVLAILKWPAIFPSPSSISPGWTAVGILVAQFPGLHLAWQAAMVQSNAALLQSFVFSSLGTFLFQYHAHEKAILTALIPTVIWYATVAPHPTAGALLWDFSAISLLSLFPLLYQSQELLLKVSSTISFLSLLSLWCHLDQPSNGSCHHYCGSTVVGVLTACTVTQLEIPYRWFWGKYEYMPLATTSIVCAVGFIWIYWRLAFFSLNGKILS
jgi:alpha-1,3-glucosyltransferase